MDTQSIIPLIIDGQDIVVPDSQKHCAIVNKAPHGPSFFQGATKELALQAAESSAKAYRAWSGAAPTQRRSLLLRLAQVCL
jgi:acyl-CoA reductase-like NAD-dependent aldehyde dehydrogenase